MAAYEGWTHYSRFPVEERSCERIAQEVFELGIRIEINHLDKI
jgi:hypothetical protein